MTTTWLILARPPALSSVPAWTGTKTGPAAIAVNDAVANVRSRRKDLDMPLSSYVNLTSNCSTWIHAATIGMKWNDRICAAPRNRKGLALRGQFVVAREAVANARQQRPS